jgi:DNA-binding XRE family transcriptional regulator
MKTSEKIKIARKAKGLTQKELALKVGAAQATINKIERDEIKNPSFDLAVKIANVLEKNVFELFSDESVDAFQLPLNTANEINELKAENERLNQKLGEKNREALLYVDMIDSRDDKINSLKEKIEAINEHLITWPEYFIMGNLYSLRKEFNDKDISEDDAVLLANRILNVASTAFLFSTNFQPGFIDILEKRLKKRYESIYDEDFKLFVNMLREIHANHEDFEKEKE